MNKRTVCVALAVAITFSGAVAVSSATEPDADPLTVVPTITEVPYVAPTATNRSQPDATPIFIPPDPTEAPTTPTPNPIYRGIDYPYEDWAIADYGPPWEVDCDDDIKENGYRMADWALGFCVPGFVTYESQFYRSPAHHWGILSSYAPGVMESQIKRLGFNPDDVRGVALMSCDHHGEEVWLRVPGVSTGWEGPFVVVDCSGRNHIYYHHVGMGLAVEIGHRQAVKWGVLVAPYVEVSIGSKPGSWSGVRLATWWLNNALEWEGE